MILIQTWGEYSNLKNTKAGHHMIYLVPTNREVEQGLSIFSAECQ